MSKQSDLVGVSQGSAGDPLYVDSTNNKVGIGTSSPSAKLHVKQPADNNGIRINHAARATSTFWDIHLSGVNNEGLAFRQNNGSTTVPSYVAGRDFHLFYTSNSEAMRITSSGSVGIGTSSPQSALHVVDSGNPTLTISGSDGAYTSILKIQAAGGGSSVINATGATSDALVLQTTGTERLRLDASGNLLVGKTSAADINTNGFQVESNGRTGISRDSGSALLLNRTSSDGPIALFRKNGSTVGSIGNNGSRPYICSTGHGLYFGSTATLPTNGSGGVVDNTYDFGVSSYRWDDIYATNGTIQTSDRNEKQDIAALTATEMLVAARISAMFKTFRWIDSVADNPNARTHTGIIAQDVQQAFTDEGLDAGDYSLFISTTWWEADGETYDTQADAPEGATERTRMGIRYPELLSFIAAYNDQRFASIEARLTALEAN